MTEKSPIEEVNKDKKVEVVNNDEHKDEHLVHSYKRSHPETTDHSIPVHEHYAHNPGTKKVNEKVNVAKVSEAKPATQASAATVTKKVATKKVATPKVATKKTATKKVATKNNEENSVKKDLEKKVAAATKQINDESKAKKAELKEDEIPNSVIIANESISEVLGVDIIGPDTTEKRSEFDESQLRKLATTKLGEEVEKARQNADELELKAKRLRDQYEAERLNLSSIQSEILAKESEMVHFKSVVENELANQFNEKAMLLKQQQQNAAIEKIKYESVSNSYRDKVKQKMEELAIREKQIFERDKATRKVEMRKFKERIYQSTLESELVDEEIREKFGKAPDTSSNRINELTQFIEVISEAKEKH